MEIEYLKKFLVEFSDNVEFEHDLKKKTGLILGANQKFFIKQKI
tara:strand:+ start:927 stop:1058 length:132 start_codon:yes stop_codon:yes gene_type:complete